jgi:hypothetical protein
MIGEQREVESVRSIPSRDGDKGFWRTVNDVLVKAVG